MRQALPNRRVENFSRATCEWIMREAGDVLGWMGYAPTSYWIAGSVARGIADPGDLDLVCILPREQAEACIWQADNVTLQDFDYAGDVLSNRLGIDVDLLPQNEIATPRGGFPPVSAEGHAVPVYDLTARRLYGRQPGQIVETRFRYDVERGIHVFRAS